MVVAFFIVITSIVFITLRLLSSRVRVIRIQSPENLRNKGELWEEILHWIVFFTVMEELAKP